MNSKKNNKILKIITVRIKYIITLKMNKPIIITLHGGCFVGGSASWDAAQTKCLTDLGLDVRQLDFPKDELEETLTYIHKYIKEIDSPVFILGRSSGGFLAKVLTDKYPKLIEKAIYLSPVFNPQLRANINTKFKSKQDHYFRNGYKYNTSKFNKDTEILFIATHDENVPKECFTKKQIESANSNCLGIRSHKGMTTTSSKAFCSMIKQKLNL